MRYLMITVRILLLAMLLTGCGELFDVNDVPELDTKVMLADQHIDLMVGDRYVLPKTIKPDSLKDMPLYWSTDDKDVAYFSGDTAVAVAPGKTYLRVSLVSMTSTDSCEVTVHPQWQQFDPTQYRYDMVLFANVKVNGHALGADDAVGAFTTDGEQHGVGERLKTDDGKEFMMIRIYSNEPAGDDIVLRCFDRERVKVVQAKNIIPFYSDEIIPNGGFMDLTFD